MILTTVYKKPQGILLKLTLENLEISGNVVLEIGWTPWKKKGTKLKYRFLKDGVCPTIFCPSYLSGKKSAERPTRASASSAREGID